jgi:hypothetical protein
MSIESTFDSAEERAENVHFLCGLTRRRFNCLIRTAKQLQIKITERVTNE